MSESGKVTVRIDSKGVDAEIDSASAKKFGDLVSPFTKFGKALGDRVEIWSALWNFEYAIAAAERAHEIAEKNQLPITPKPPKFLRDWALNASLEDNEEMIDRWANLLISASSEFSSSDAIHISILSNLGVHEARFLDRAWDAMPDKLRTVSFVESFGSDFMKPSMKDLTGNDFHVGEEELRRFTDEGRDWHEAPFFDGSSMIYRAEKEFLALGLYADRFKFFDDEKVYSHSGHRIEGSEHYGVCTHLGLWRNGVATYRCNHDQHDNPLMLEISLYGFTSLGVRFLAACKGFDLSEHYESRRD